jgi:hypothetical protein
MASACRFTCPSSMTKSRAQTWKGSVLSKDGEEGRENDAPTEDVNREPEHALLERRKRGVAEPHLEFAQPWQSCEVHQVQAEARRESGRS